MATQTLVYNGKVRWCRPYETNQFGKYSTQFYPDKESLDRLKQLKIKNVWSKDEEGEYIKLHCPDKRVWRGKVTHLKIDVVDKDGKPITDLIGDGSDVTIKIEYYDFPSQFGDTRTHACRWVGLKVNHLIPFIRQTDPLIVEEEDKVPKSW
jgi:hypothetical protein